MHQLSPNTIIKGKKFSYTIKKVLGQGTFGITYLATVKLSGDLGDLDGNIQVCLKEFFMEELNGRIGNTVTSSNDGGLVAEYKSKFKKEALNLSRLKHDNIVKVLESFETNNTAYYSMEFLPSGSLDKYIESKHGLSEKESIGFAIQICNALSFMHQRSRGQVPLTLCHLKNEIIDKLSTFYDFHVHLMISILFSCVFKMIL